MSDAVDAQEAFERREEVVFLDVREPFEWDAGHIEGAVHVPLQSLPGNLDRLDRDRPIVAVCHVGQRSAIAADFLRRQGYDAYNLEGGMAVWAARGFPEVTGDPFPSD